MTTIFDSCLLRCKEPLDTPILTSNMTKALRFSHLFAALQGATSGSPPADADPPLPVAAAAAKTSTTRSALPLRSRPGWQVRGTRSAVLRAQKSREPQQVPVNLNWAASKKTRTLRIGHLSAYGLADSESKPRVARAASGSVPVSDVRRQGGIANVTSGAELSRHGSGEGQQEAVANKWVAQYPDRFAIPSLGSLYQDEPLIDNNLDAPEIGRGDVANARAAPGPDDSRADASRSDSLAELPQAMAAGNVADASGQPAVGLGAPGLSASRIPKLPQMPTGIAAEKEAAAVAGAELEESEAGSEGVATEDSHNTSQASLSISEDADTADDFASESSRSDSAAPSDYAQRPQTEHSRLDNVRQAHMGLFQEGTNPEPNAAAGDGQDLESTRRLEKLDPEMFKLSTAAGVNEAEPAAARSDTDSDLSPVSRRMQQAVRGVTYVTAAGVAESDEASIDADPYMETAAIAMPRRYNPASQPAALAEAKPPVAAPLLPQLGMIGQRKGAQSHGSHSKSPPKSSRKGTGYANIFTTKHATPRSVKSTSRVANRA